ARRPGSAPRPNADSRWRAAAGATESAASRPLDPPRSIRSGERSRARLAGCPDELRCSEIELQRELNLPLAGARNRPPERAGSQRGAETAESSVVEEVEELRPELYVHRLADAGVLHEGRVPVVDARAVERVLLLVPLGERRGRREGGRVEPAVDRPHVT